MLEGTSKNDAVGVNGGVKTLIVCPASLKLNWRREILMVYPEARIENIGFDKDPARDPRWVIVNYDILRKHADRLYGLEWAETWQALSKQHKAILEVAYLVLWARTVSCRRHERRLWVNYGLKLVHPFTSVVGG